MCQREWLGPCQLPYIRFRTKPSGGKRKTREKVIQKEDKRGIMVVETMSHVLSRKNTLRMMETLTSIVGLGEETYRRKLGGGKKQGLAEEDNEVRVEKTGLHCTARMRKNQDADASLTLVLLLAVLFEMGGLGEKDANNSPSCNQVMMDGRVTVGQLKERSFSMAKSPREQSAC